jgi:hypothetical protein
MLWVHHSMMIVMNSPSSPMGLRKCSTSLWLPLALDVTGTHTRAQYDWQVSASVLVLSWLDLPILTFHSGSFEEFVLLLSWRELSPIPLTTMWRLLKAALFWEPLRYPWLVSQALQAEEVGLTPARVRSHFSVDVCH